MPTRFTLVALVALTAGCSRQPSAQSPSAEPTATSSPAELEPAGCAESLQKALPAGWTLASTSTSINIRRIDPAAYYVPAPGLPRMSKEEEDIFIERHTRTAVLEFRLRFAPQLSSTESARLARENEQLVQQAEKEFPNSKGNAVSRFLEAHPGRKLHEMPAFRTARHSVYLDQPVRCEWLRDSTIQSQCGTVQRAISGLFGAERSTTSR